MRTPTLLFVFALFALLLSSSTVEASANGGTPCAACTLVIQLLLNLMAIDEEAFDHILLSYCTTLPEPYATPCILFAESLGEQMVSYIGENASSDDMCRALGVCTSTTCNLMPSRSGIKPAPRKFILPHPNFLKVSSNNLSAQKKLQLYAILFWVDSIIMICTIISPFYV